MRVSGRYLGVTFPLGRAPDPSVKRQPCAPRLRPVNPTTGGSRWKRANPQDLIRKTIAAIAGVVAMGLFVASQGVAPTDATAADATPEAETPALPAAGYFPAQFQIRPAADESAEPIPTF